MSDSDEDYAEYGTPLEPLDEDAVPKKRPLRLEEIVARNSRPRFHGAFTGGFSAGFFNSVGSLEGWTPSSFKSSRSEKAERRVQKPEDFMDDEDVGQFGITPKVLRATSDYTDHLGKRKRERTAPSTGPIPGEPVLKQLLKPVRETVGIKLLKRMGWRPGQGVGPRVTKKEKRQFQIENNKLVQKVYGCAKPNAADGYNSSGNSDSSSDEENVNITFAPDDYEPFLCKPKDNCFGIGYSGLEKRSVLSSHLNLFQPSTLIMNEKNKKVSITGQAFGVGALEEDDEDIYALEDMSQYDFSLGPSKTEKNQTKKTSQSGVGMGRSLDGFAQASHSVNSRKYFPPPALPPNFEPIHAARKTRFEPDSSQSNETNFRKMGLQRHSLSSSDRGHILDGRGPSSSSVIQENEMEENKIIAREAAKLTEKLSAESSGMKFFPFAGRPEKQKRYEQYIDLVKTGRKGEFHKCQPLDMTEWQREQELAEFERVEKLAVAMNDRFIPASSSASESTQEVVPVCESAAKAKMFGKLTRERCVWKPTSLLCKRFNVPEPHSGTSQPSSSILRKKGISKFSVFDYLEAASHNNMIPHTQNTDIRESAEVICTVSEKKEDFVPLITEKDKVKKKEDFVPLITQKDNVKNESELSVNSKTVASVEKDVEEKEVSFADPPSKMDLFKAVFLSSSEEESDSDDNDDENKDKKKSAKQSEPILSIISSAGPTNQSEEKLVAPTYGISTYAETQPLIRTPASELNVLRNTSPPRGIFANLDLDAINSKIKEGMQGKYSNSMNELNSNATHMKSRLDGTTRGVDSLLDEPLTSKDSKHIQEKIDDSDTGLENEMYGPSLPSTPIATVCKVTNLVSHFQKEDNHSSFVWVEKNDKSSHKHKHKKEHKKASKHKKHKSKKHKKSRHK